MSPTTAFLAALRAVLPDEPGLAVIHSSFAKLVPPSDFEPRHAVRALATLAREGWTLALPAFTFSFCGTGEFDLRTTPSETGALADWVLRMAPGAQRSRHPIYSFVFLGPGAPELAQLEGETVFGPGSVFERFEQDDAAFVMLGCGWTYNTQFHRYEELAQVPYRYFKRFDGHCCGEECSADMYVRDLDIDPANDFSQAVHGLRKGGLIRTASLWRGEVEAVSGQALAQECREALRQDLFVYVQGGAAVARMVAHSKTAQTQEPVRVAVLGRSNLDLLTRDLADRLRELVSDRRIETFALPFGQLDQQVLDPGSDLHGFAPDFVLFADRIEDLMGGRPLDLCDPGDVHARVEEHAVLIRNYRQQRAGWIAICRFASLAASATPDQANAGLVARANAVLEDALADQDQIAWIDTATEAALCEGSAVDMRLWHIGRIPYTTAFAQRLARKAAGVYLAANGRTVRLVVLDLDNTLWGGVLGEDGIEGIAIGGDYPGNAFSQFQKALAQLSERGIALAVASKNDEDLALKALTEHPEVMIRPELLVDHAIGWTPKAEGIARMANALNLGLASVMFIDDSPVECEAVRRSLPDVKTVELPKDPAEFARILGENPLLAVNEITAEDRRRVESYRHRATIENARVSATSLEDFYASLEMTLYLDPLDAGNVARAVQLCGKTNQFNTRTRRYDKVDLERMIEAGSDVIVIGLADRATPRENIGLLILSPDPDDPAVGYVDNYLLSCRVLGRGVETTVLQWALRRAREKGWATLRGEIIETERNTPARDVFERAGFAHDGTHWHHSTAQAPDLPDWLEIESGMA
jgi:FkbH-like protein